MSDLSNAAIDCRHSRLQRTLPPKVDSQAPTTESPTTRWRPPNPHPERARRATQRSIGKKNVSTNSNLWKSVPTRIRFTLSSSSSSIRVSFYPLSALRSLSVLVDFWPRSGGRKAAGLSWTSRPSSARNTTDTRPSSISRAWTAIQTSTCTRIQVGRWEEGGAYQRCHSNSKLDSSPQNHGGVKYLQLWNVPTGPCSFYCSVSETLWTQKGLAALISLSLHLSPLMILADHHRRGLRSSASERVLECQGPSRDIIETAVLQGSLDVDEDFPVHLLIQGARKKVWN